MTPPADGARTTIRRHPWTVEQSFHLFRSRLRHPTRRRLVTCERQPWASYVRPHLRLLRFPAVPGICRPIVAVLVRTSISLETASPPGSPAETRKLRGGVIPARTFDRTPSLFTRYDQFLVNFTVLQPTTRVM